MKLISAEDLIKDFKNTNLEMMNKQIYDFIIKTINKQPTIINFDRK